MNDCKVVIGYGESEKDITQMVGGNDIRITLSDGVTLSIETFERRPGRITIRSSATGGALVVFPQASNSIDIGESKNG